LFVRSEDPGAQAFQAPPPLRWPGLGPADSDDPAVVTRCYDEVVSAMQGMLDRLSEGRRPWLGKP